MRGSVAAWRSTTPSTSDDIGSSGAMHSSHRSYTWATTESIVSSNHFASTSWTGRTRLTSGRHSHAALARWRSTERGRSRFVLIPPTAILGRQLLGVGAVTGDLRRDRPVRPSAGRAHHPQHGADGTLAVGPDRCDEAHDLSGRSRPGHGDPLHPVQVRDLPAEHADPLIAFGQRPLTGLEQGRDTFELVPVGLLGAGRVQPTAGAWPAWRHGSGPGRSRGTARGALADAACRGHRTGPERPARCEAVHDQDSLRPGPLTHRRPRGPHPAGGLPRFGGVEAQTALEQRSDAQPERHPAQQGPDPVERVGLRAELSDVLVLDGDVLMSVSQFAVQSNDIVHPEAEFVFELGQPCLQLSGVGSVVG